MMFMYPDQIYENAIDKVMQILGNYVWPFQGIIVRKIYEKIVLDSLRHHYLKNDFGIKGK